MTRRSTSLFLLIVLAVLLAFAFGRVSSPAPASASVSDARIADVVAQLRQVDRDVQTSNARLADLRTELGHGEAGQSLAQQLDDLRRAVGSGGYGDLGELLFKLSASTTAQSSTELARLTDICRFAALAVSRSGGCDSR